MQTRKQSLKEAIVNTSIGFAISICATFLVNWLHSVEIPVWKNFSMTICFTLISLIRQYIIRR